MMYQDKFVVAIKVGGKVLRETKDLVQMPFGSEFSVLVKNLNSRRAKFTLHIDGTDVLDGDDVVVNANSEVEMKRFFRNGNMDEGNAFKFIERTQSIEDGPRGIKVDDGIVRVEFWFEQAPPVITTTTTIHHHKDVWWDEYYRIRSPYGSPYYSTTYGAGALGDVRLGHNIVAQTASKGIMRGAGGSMTGGSAASGSATAYNVSTHAASIPVPDLSVNNAGITVPGSKVEQKFMTVYGFNPEAESQVIILRMVGRSGNVQVAAPVTVKSKQKCSTCGKVNKATAKFCTDCGTALELL
jgi:hypothetical protein